LAAILSKPVSRQWFATCEPPNPYRSQFSTEFAGIRCISVTKDEARRANEESAQRWREATQKLVNWVSAGTVSGAFCISGRSSPHTHQLAIRERGPSLTMRGAQVSPTVSPVGQHVDLCRAATFNPGSTTEPISHRTRFRIGLGSLRRNSRANNPQSSK